MSAKSAGQSRWMKGIVDWFDDLSGRGMIRSSSGEWYFVHYSAIESNQRRKSLKKKQEVKFKACKDIENKQAEKIKVL